MLLDCADATQTIFVGCPPSRAPGAARGPRIAAAVERVPPGSARGLPRGGALGDDHLRNIGMYRSLSLRRLIHRAWGRGERACLLVVAFASRCGFNQNR